MLQRVVTILSLTMFCALACGSSTDCNANASPNPKDDPIAIVRKYVATHRTWKTTDYKISEDHKENAVTVYLVFYLPDKAIGYPGSGQSFLAYYAQGLAQSSRKCGSSNRVS